MVSGEVPINEVVPVSAVDHGWPSGATGSRRLCSRRFVLIVSARAGRGAAMAERVCFMHVGTGKTGSTAIQLALTQEQRYLSAEGVDYPDLSKNLNSASTGRPTAGNGVALFRELRHGNIADPIDIIRDHVNTTNSFIISCEGLCQLPRATLMDFVSAIKDLGFRVKGLAYFRPQVDFLVSSYLQKVKTAKVDWKVGVDEYIRGCVKTIRSRESAWNWLGVADELADVFGKDGLRVHWYPILASKGHDEIVKSFFAWIEVPMPEEYAGGGISNPSPNPEALIILRMMNSAGLGGRAFAYEFLAQAHAAKLLDKRPMLSKEHLALIDGLTRRDNQEMLKRYAPGYSSELLGDAPTDLVADQGLLRKEVVAEMLQMAGQVLASQGTVRRPVSDA